VAETGASQSPLDWSQIRRRPHSPRSPRDIPASKPFQRFSRHLGPFGPEFGRFLSRALRNGAAKAAFCPPFCYIVAAFGVCWVAPHIPLHILRPFLSYSFVAS